MTALQFVPPAMRFVPGIVWQEGFCVNIPFIKSEMAGIQVNSAC